MRSILFPSLFALAIACFFSAPASISYADDSTPVIVYNSLTTPAGGGFSNDLNKPAGQSVTLTGSNRVVTNFEAALDAGNPNTFTIQFLLPDGPGSQPGTVFWTSPIQTYPYTSGPFNRKVVSVDVPDVTVPDTFVWDVTFVTGGGGVANYNGPPSVGAASTAWAFDSLNANPTTGWGIYGGPAIIFGAQISAIPEPSTLALLALGSLGLFVLRNLKTV